MPETEIIQLKNLGADENYLEQAREHYREQAESNVEEVVLWPDLEGPFRVFRFCKWTMIAGLSGVVATGIPGAEIRAIAEPLGIEINDQLFDDIRVMENAASPIINAKK